jgi:hypothetical protein
MSHNICYLDVKENAKRDDVMYEIEYHADREGDGYSSRVKWHDEISPCESREEAYKRICDLDNGWYDDHAVRYKKYDRAKKTKKIEEYEKKVAELIEGKKIYAREHSIQSFQATHVGCKHCGSKLYKKLIRTECCPLCHTDLRSETTLKKLQWYDDKRAEYENRIAAEEKKQKRGYEIYWLVKYEFHS